MIAKLRDRLLQAKITAASPSYDLYRVADTSIGECVLLRACLSRPVHESWSAVVFQQRRSLQSMLLKSEAPRVHESRWTMYVSVASAVIFDIMSGPCLNAEVADQVEVGLRNVCLSAFDAVLSAEAGAIQSPLCVCVFLRAE